MTIMHVTHRGVTYQFTLAAALAFARARTWLEREAILDRLPHFWRAGSVWEGVAR